MPTTKGPGADDWFGEWLTRLPLAERYWHSEFKRLDGHFPELHDATERDIQKLKAARRKHPDHVARRVVLTFDGNPIWCHAHLGKITWFKVTWEQDRQLDA